MASFLRQLPRAQLVAAVVVVAVLGGVGFLPLFGGPGYEQSLASGVVVPAAAAIATALDLSRRAILPAPVACIGRGVATGAVLAALALLTALVHGVFSGVCDLWGGLAFFALTAGFGALMGGAWGAVVAEVCRAAGRGRLACVLLALAAPVGGILVSVARFYGSPMIFSFDPFFGFFSGALYDTVVDERVQLCTYRAGSLATLTGVALVASSLVRAEKGRLRFAPLRSGSSARLLLGVAAFAVSAALVWEGPALGHFETAGTIARALGGRISGARCDVIYPDSVVGDRAALLLRDCEQELRADEEVLGTRLPGRLTAYVFHDSAQKRALMGAAQTSIAKPWRREVYVQLSTYPHPLLGHEVAHVVAGSFGRGPFRVAGALGGLWPNPGLIEGVAVATSPEDDELTDAQWARALLDLGALTPVEKLFTIDFLGENAQKSYTVAGAFVSWVRDRWGAGVVRAWYGGASIERLTGHTWGGLDGEFRASLRALPMPPGASAYAAARFQRPSVWGRRCPHAVDALDRDGDQCRVDHRFGRAAELYDGALALDPHDWHARFERAHLETWYGDQNKGRADLGRISADPDAPRTWRDRAEEALADDDLGLGHVDRAVAAYRRLAARTLDEDVRRTLEVKAQSAADDDARQAVLDLLVGERGRPVDPWVGGLSLGAWAQASLDPVAAYLAGKNLALHDRYARAATWLDRVLAANAAAPLTPSMGRELLRQRAICACAMGDAPALDRVGGLVDAAGSPFADSAGAGRKEWLLRFVARCREDEERLPRR